MQTILTENQRFNDSQNFITLYKLITASNIIFVVLVAKSFFSHLIKKPMVFFSFIIMAPCSLNSFGLICSRKINGCFSKVVV